VHIHDNFGGSSPHDDLHLPVGDGIVNFAAIFRALSVLGYDRTMTIELKPREIEQCINRVKDLLKNSARA